VDISEYVECFRQLFEQAKNDNYAVYAKEIDGQISLNIGWLMQDSTDDPDIQIMEDISI